MIAADYLRERELAGLSQAELAKRVGKSRTHVINVETGRSNASPEYEALFLWAVGDKYQEGDTQSGLVRAPALRAKRKVANSAEKLHISLKDLAKLRYVVASVVKAVRDLTDSAHVLADDVIALDATSFNPKSALPAEMVEVEEYIMGVMLELVTDHNFHTLPDAELDSYIDGWSRTVAREAKKRRNRMDSKTA